MEDRFDCIVLGATFAAAGLAAVLGPRCLILEEGPLAGYEFISALHFGDGYEAPLQSAAARELQTEFHQRGAFENGRICLLDCAGPLYRRLQDQKLLLNTAVAGVTKTEDGFSLLTHGVAGFRRWQARHIIDTRPQPQDITTKSLNALLTVPEDAAPPPELALQRWGHPGQLVLQCPVAADADEPQARAALNALLQQTPYRLALTAECFTHTVAAAGPFRRDGIIGLPSCAYRNPLLAYDAGVLYAEEVLRHAAF